MDDLLDLSWSDKPSKPTLQSQSAGATRQPTPTASFDFLSKQPSKPNYYAGATPLRGSTPQTAPLPTTSRLQTRSTTPNPASSDAFSSLLSFAPGSNGTGKTLSLGERQQQAERERQEKAERERAQFEANGSFWDNLGSSSIPPKNGSSSNGLGELLSPQPMPFARPPSALNKTHTPTPPKRDLWDDDDTFLSGPSKPAAPRSVAPDPFDFDAFNETMNAPSSKSAQNPNRHTDPVLYDDDMEVDLLGGSVKPRSKQVN